MPDGSRHRTVELSADSEHGGQAMDDEVTVHLIPEPVLTSGAIPWAVFNAESQYLGTVVEDSGLPRVRLTVVMT